MDGPRKNIQTNLLLREYGFKPVPKTLETSAEMHLIRKSLVEQECDLPGVAITTFLMVFSPDGKKVASTHGNHHIYVTDVRTGKNITTLVGHPRTPWCIAFHPTSSNILASGCLGGQVRVWDLNGGSEIWNYSTYNYERSIASIAFHPSGKILAIAVNHEIYFWNWWSASYPLYFTSTSHEKIRYVAFDKTGTKLITGIRNDNNRRYPNAFDTISSPNHLWNRRIPPNEIFLSPRSTVIYGGTRRESHNDPNYLSARNYSYEGLRVPRRSFMHQPSGEHPLATTIVSNLLLRYSAHFRRLHALSTSNNTNEAQRNSYVTPTDVDSVERIPEENPIVGSNNLQTNSARENMTDRGTDPMPISETSTANTNSTGESSTNRNESSSNAQDALFVQAQHVVFKCCNVISQSNFILSKNYIKIMETQGEIDPKIRWPIIYVCNMISQFLSRFPHYRIDRNNEDVPNVRLQKKWFKSVLYMRTNSKSYCRQDDFGHFEDPIKQLVQSNFSRLNEEAKLAHFKKLITLITTLSEELRNRITLYDVNQFKDSSTADCLMTKRYFRLFTKQILYYIMLLFQYIANLVILYEYSMKKNVTVRPNQSESVNESESTSNNEDTREQSEHGYWLLEENNVWDADDNQNVDRQQCTSRWIQLNSSSDVHDNTTSLCVRFPHSSVSIGRNDLSFSRSNNQIIKSCNNNSLLSNHAEILSTGSSSTSLDDSKATSTRGDAHRGSNQSDTTINSSKNLNLRRYAEEKIEWRNVSIENETNLSSTANLSRQSDSSQTEPIFDKNSGLQTNTRNIRQLKLRLTTTTNDTTNNETDDKIFDVENEKWVYKSSECISKWWIRLICICHEYRTGIILYKWLKLRRHCSDNLMSEQPSTSTTSTSTLCQQNLSSSSTESNNNSSQRVDDKYICSLTKQLQSQCYSALLHMYNEVQCVKNTKLRTRKTQKNDLSEEEEVSLTSDPNASCSGDSTEHNYTPWRPLDFQRDSRRFNQRNNYANRRNLESYSKRKKVDDLHVLYFRYNRMLLSLIKAMKHSPYKSIISSECVATLIRAISGLFETMMEDLLAFFETDNIQTDSLDVLENRLNHLTALFTAAKLLTKLVMLASKKSKIKFANASTQTNLDHSTMANISFENSTNISSGTNEENTNSYQSDCEQCKKLSKSWQELVRLCTEYDTSLQQKLDIPTELSHYSSPLNNATSSSSSINPQPSTSKNAERLNLPQVNVPGTTCGIKRPAPESDDILNNESQTRDYLLEDEQMLNLLLSKLQIQCCNGLICLELLPRDIIQRILSNKTLAAASAEQLDIHMTILSKAGDEMIRAANDIEMIPNGGSARCPSFVSRQYQRSIYLRQPGCWPILNFSGNSTIMDELSNDNTETLSNIFRIISLLEEMIERINNYTKSIKSYDSSRYRNDLILLLDVKSLRVVDVVIKKMIEFFGMFKLQTDSLDVFEYLVKRLMKAFKVFQALTDMIAEHMSVCEPNASAKYVVNSENPNDNKDLIIREVSKELEETCDKYYVLLSNKRFKVKLIAEFPKLVDFLRFSDAKIETQVLHFYDKLSTFLNENTWTNKEKTLLSAIQRFVEFLRYKHKNSEIIDEALLEEWCSIEEELKCQNNDIEENEQNNLTLIDAFLSQKFKLNSTCQLNFCTALTGLYSLMTINKLVLNSSNRRLEQSSTSSPIATNNGDLSPLDSQMINIIDIILEWVNKGEEEEKEDAANTQQNKRQKTGREEISRENSSSYSINFSTTHLCSEQPSTSSTNVSLDSTATSAFTSLRNLPKRKDTDKRDIGEVGNERREKRENDETERRNNVNWRSSHARNLLFNWTDYQNSTRESAARRQELNVPVVEINGVPVNDFNSLSGNPQRRLSSTRMDSISVAPRLREIFFRNLSASRLYYDMALRRQMMRFGFLFPRYGRYVSGGFLSSSESSSESSSNDDNDESDVLEHVRISMIQDTYRIQVWDFSKRSDEEYYIPNISDDDRNIVVRECKIQNDASIDISPDGTLLATLLPNGSKFLPRTVISVYSLELKTLGECLYSIETNHAVVSVSLSPTNNHLLVGLGTHTYHPHLPMAQIYQLTKEDSNLENDVGRLAANRYRMRSKFWRSELDKLPTSNDSTTENTNSKKRLMVLMRELMQKKDGMSFAGLNCIRWTPQPGQGMVCATTNGLLTILK